MKSILVTIAGALLIIALLVGLSYAFGWIGVHQTATIGAASQDSKREIFENSQSYVEGKKQEASKLYLEYQRSDSESAKGAIRAVVAQSFANFDETKLEGRIKHFVISCKYGDK